MCHLYSITEGQAAIIAFTRAMRDCHRKCVTDARCFFSDYQASFVRNGRAARENPCGALGHARATAVRRQRGSTTEIPR
jgi:hypothetical protein